MSFGGVDERGKSFVYLEFLLASWGGGPDRDGMDACTGTLVNYSNTPAEMIEADQPIAVEHYGFVPDTGGAGRVARRTGARAASALQGRRRSAADPLGPSRPSHLRPCRRRPGRGLGRRRSGARTARWSGSPPNSSRAVRKRRRAARAHWPGGGGHGDPFARDPQRSWRICCEEKISREHARAAYGVVISGDPPAVDAARRPRCGRFGSGHRLNADRKRRRTSRRGTVAIAAPAADCFAVNCCADPREKTAASSNDSL